MITKYLDCSFRSTLALALAVGFLWQVEAEASNQGCNPATTGTDNACYGVGAGAANTTGYWNSFFGAYAGTSNTTGIGNTFFGLSSGSSNIDGSSNVFLGSDAGASNSSGSSNVVVGASAGKSITTQTQNTLVGFSTNGAAGISNATALGAQASVTQSNSLVLGSIAGVNGANASTRVGIGTSAPKARLHVEGGDVYIKSLFSGIILRATNGANCFRVTVDNAGVLKTTMLVACP